MKIRDKVKSKIQYGMAWLNVKAGTMLAKRREGIDKVLVVVGFCIIALVVMVSFKTKLTDFITDMFSDMTTKAKGILNGT